MKKINEEEIDKIKEEFQYYNFDDFNSRYQLKIKFSPDIDSLTYSDLIYNSGQVKVYKEKEQQIMSLCYLLLSHIEDDKWVAVKFNEVWFTNRKKSSKLRKIFHKNHIKLRNTPAIEVDKNSEIMNLLILSSLRYNSFVQFLLLKKRIVFTVTDHMDIFINLEKLDDVCFIEQALEEYNEQIRKELFIIEKNFQMTK